MEHIRNWLLPVALWVAWFAFAPKIAADDGLPLSQAEFIAGAAASAIAVVALSFRRRAPLTALGITTAVLIVGQLAIRRDGIAVLPVEMVALYSVAVRRTPLVSRRALGALAVVQTAAVVIFRGVNWPSVFEAVTNLILYAVIVGGGQNRRRRLAARAETARQLQQAETRRMDAAAGERRRLARELHDVSAHHLTSIVVTGTAAERLAETQPSLAREALAYAADTGRETLRSLHELVAMLTTSPHEHREPLSVRIAGLAEAFERLGQQVVVDVAPDLSGPVADAVFGIVRESLTNTLRYAPGAAVRVLVTRSADQVDVLVENGRAPEAQNPGQGSRRGIAGMKERAAAAGGTLTAGPSPDGGWRVSAQLRTAPAAAPRPPRLSRQERWLGESGVLLSLTLASVGGTTLVVSEEGLDTARTSLAILLAFIPCLIMLGRRDRPWTTLTGVTLSTWLWPLALGLNWLPTDVAPAVVCSLPVLAAAVYAVAAYGEEPHGSFLSVIVASTGFGAATTALIALSPTEQLDFATFAGVTTSAALAGLLLTCWLPGDLMHRKRKRPSELLAHLVYAAELEVHAERHRIATGLHHTVLTRTQAMITLAEAGDLPATLTEARAALTAMRDLLATLDPPPTAPLTPYESRPT